LTAESGPPRHKRKRGGPLPTLHFVIALLAGATSCTPVDSPRPIVVATDWSTAETSQLPIPSDSQITWIRVAPGDDPTALLDLPNHPVDVVLGGPWNSFEHLDRLGSWSPIETQRSEGESRWRLAPFPRSPRQSDPRQSPAARGQARQLLQSQNWSEAYAHRVLERQPAASPANPAVDSAALDPIALVAKPDPHPDAAKWVQSITPLSAPSQSQIAQIEPIAIALLGATLIDSQPERDAALGLQPGLSERERNFLSEAPPWPPASIERLSQRAANGDEEAASLLTTLLDELTPNPSAKSFLSQSAQSKAHPIDLDDLSAIAAALNSRPIQNPRLLTFLRAEWTAWARQRYRRVARLASGWTPNAAPQNNAP
jgi:hypothetical protein